MIYAVTGPSRLLKPEECLYVQQRVRRTVLRRGNRHNYLVSGMAYGVDTEAVLAVWGLLPFDHIICVLPGTCNHNRGLSERLDKAGALIVQVPNKHTVSATYLSRDDEVVAQLSGHGNFPKERGVLLSFPEHRKEEQRSGTWATIRRAKKRGHRVRYYPLDKVEVNDED